MVVVISTTTIWRRSTGARARARAEGERESEREREETGEDRSCSTGEKANGENQQEEIE